MSKTSPYIKKPVRYSPTLGFVYDDYLKKAYKEKQISKKTLELYTKSTYNYSKLRMLPQLIMDIDAIRRRKQGQEVKSWNVYNPIK